MGLFLSSAIIFVKNKKLCVALLVTFVVASIFNHFLKAFIGRARPFDSYNDIINYGNEDGYSMPSGHSLCGGIFASFLIYNLILNNQNIITRLLGTLAYTSIAFLIVFSRMVLGVHYLTDTIAGLFLGISFAIVGIIVYNVVKKKHDSKPVKNNKRGE